jgi:microcystin-dependent protein
MSYPYIGEIRLFAGNFAPAGWAPCDGRLLAVDDYEALFALIGTTYGGDGQATFALPDLRGRVPVHQGQAVGLSNWVVGETRGVETVTLTTAQLPSHSHPMVATTHVASKGHGPGEMLGTSPDVQVYGTGAPTVPMAPHALSKEVGSQPHDNMGPSLAVNFIISLFGVFPSQG